MIHHCRGLPGSRNGSTVLFAPVGKKYSDANGQWFNVGMRGFESHITLGA